MVSRIKLSTLLSFFVLLLIVPTGYIIQLGASISQDESESRSYYYCKISVNSIAHENYGLRYPMTYVFNIPRLLEGGKVFWTDKENGIWSPLIEKNSSEFFNGLDCVRFDYSKHLAYISIRFANDSDDLFFRLEDKKGQNRTMTFSNIATYYDNRKAVFVWSLDDYPEDVRGPAENQSYFDFDSLARNHSIWVTSAINTDYIHDWRPLQSDIDQGFLEIASHSAGHPDTTPYLNAEYEVKTSKEAIISNLKLSEYYRKGSRQYVPCWIEPTGAVDEEVRRELGKNLYLIDRSTQDNQTWIAPWDPQINLFARIGATLKVEDETDAKAANSSFDYYYARQDVIHFWSHPWKMLDNGTCDTFKSGTWLDNLMGYVGQRKDVWYVGFGALYMYQLPIQTNGVTIQEYIPSDTPWILQGVFFYIGIMSVIQIMIYWKNHRYSKSKR